MCTRTRFWRGTGIVQMVLGLETDSTFANFNYEMRTRERHFLGRQGDNTPSPSYGRRAVSGSSRLTDQVFLGVIVPLVSGKVMTAISADKRGGRNRSDQQCSESLCSKTDRGEPTFAADSCELGWLCTY
jgi:hypothetical protein